MKSTGSHFFKNQAVGHNLQKEQMSPIHSHQGKAKNLGAATKLYYQNANESRPITEQMQRNGANGGPQTQRFTSHQTDLNEFYMPRKRITTLPKD